MVIEIDRTDKTKSIYKCDRCEKELILGRDERFRIAVQVIPKRRKSIIKNWDLCKRCYLSLYRGIEKKNN